MNRRALLAIAIAASLLAPSAGAAAPVTRRAKPTPPDHGLTVFVAASLADALEAIAWQYERAHPGLKVRMNVAGSQQLSAQLALGSPADVFASADEGWMKRVAARGRVAGEPVEFAINRPVVIVSRTRGAAIRSLADLARPGVKLVLGAPAVPIGHYSREALSKLGRQPGYPKDFAKRVLANVVSEEENVKGVAGKVSLGEADAGIVYRSDVTPSLAPNVRVLEFPKAASVRAPCWIAVLKGKREAAAREFVELVRSDRGRRVLAERGFAPARQE